MSITAYITRSDFVIPEDKVSKVFDKSYTYIIGQESQTNPNSKFKDVVNLSDLMNKSFLNHKVEDNGDITITGHDATLTYATSILEFAAPYVKEGSFVEWEEEDGAIRLDEVINGKYDYGDPYEPDWVEDDWYAGEYDEY